MSQTSNVEQHAKYSPSKKFKNHLASRADNFDAYKERQKSKSFINSWTKDETLPNPFDVTKEFIMEKGLKIYGGLALHEHLKKRNNPIYNKFDFPDYDVFSPNAWEHAKELCDKLYNMGFYFVEARSSLMNDDIHQTYKVSVDMIYMLDLTQSGCSSMQLKNKDCKTCGLSKDDKCISIFNNIPAYNLLENSTKEYKKVFDYKNDTSLVPNKLLVCSPDWLKISMYRELTEPLTMPIRFEKVAGRLDMFTKKYPFVANKCNLYDIDKKSIVSQEKHRSDLKQVLSFLNKYLDQNKYINHGIKAYNFFIKGKNNLPELPINHYEAYTNYENINDFTPLIKLLQNKFKECIFKIQENICYWREADVKDYTIYCKKNNGTYEKIVVFSSASACLPYIQYTGSRYVTLDRMKYHFYRNIALDEVIKNTEKYQIDYSCLLNNLIKIEKDVKKKYPLLDKGKYRRFVLKCEGERLDTLMTRLFTRFGEKIELAKKVEYIIDEPRKGMITKTYDASNSNNKLKLPYTPSERVLKKYKKLSKKTGKYEIQNMNKKTKKRYLFNNTNIL